MESRLPGVPGNEFAGVVDQVGAGIAGIVVGDEVLGFGFMNAAAEFIAVPADQVTAKPAGMPWDAPGHRTFPIHHAVLVNVAGKRHEGKNQH
nr:alcohol dehydrogenase catalytic domain-containing protein [Micromonospora tarapacensis]